VSGEYYLGLDVGTQGTKGIVVAAATQQVVARASASYDLLPGLPEGAAEQHPQTWLEAIATVARALWDSVDAAAVRGLAISGQQHGLVVLDSAGEVLRPAKLWCDTVAFEEAQEISAALGEPIPAGFTAPKVMWLARHEPQVWERTQTVLLPHDFINYRLTGRACMEAGDASGTGFFDVATGRFRAERLARVDPALADRVPELVPAGAWIGALDARGAELLGLAPGTPVATGAGDNMASALGSGATRAGVYTLSLGTSGTLFCRSDVPARDPGGSVAAFCSSDGAYLPLLCVMNLTGVTGEVERAFGLDLDHLTRRARAVAPGCEGVQWLPYLAGERVPDLPQATGTLLGLRAGSLAPEVLFRAALEGTTLNLAWGAERMSALVGAPSELRLVGGAARNELWRSILASALDCPVVALGEPESAALGAAVQALWTARREHDPNLASDAVAQRFVQRAGEPTLPDAELRDCYAELGRSFRANVRALYAVD